MSRILTVLGALVCPVPFDPQATLDKFEDEVQLARKAFGAADLLLSPELYLTGDDPFAGQARAGFEREVAEDSGSAHRAGRQDPGSGPALDLHRVDLRAWPEG